MYASPSKIILSATLALASSGLFCAHAEAGPFDWLFGKKQPTTVNYAPYTTYYAPQAAYQVPHTTYYAPATTCSVSYKPVTTVQYAQQTGYRTNYARVPTTVYRPVASVDGTTGCAVTVMKPCTTWTWQARRVPYTTYKPVYTTRYVGTQTCQTPICRLPACGTPSCATGTCGTTNYAQPTYQSYGQASSCSSCRGIGCASCAPAPSTVSSTIVSQTPTPATAADRAPVLKVPANTPAPMAVPQTTAPTHTETPKLQAIPRPEDQPASANPNNAPDLLNPRAHTASAATKRAYGFTPIAWPDTKVIRQMSAEQPIAPRKLDASGWEVAE